MKYGFNEFALGIVAEILFACDGFVRWGKKIVAESPTLSARFLAAKGERPN
jgi:hypothetical protein